jgi:hypothetical protein
MIVKWTSFHLNFYRQRLLRDGPFDFWRGKGANLKKYPACPELMKKYRAQQVCKANISQKFEKIYRAKPMTAAKIEHFQKAPPPLSTKGCTVFCNLSASLHWNLIFKILLINILQLIVWLLNNRLVITASSNQGERKLCGGIFLRFRNSYFLCILGGVLTEIQSDKQWDNDYNFVVYLLHNCAPILKITNIVGPTWWFLETKWMQTCSEVTTSSPEKFWAPWGIWMQDHIHILDLFF